MKRKKHKKNQFFWKATVAIAVALAFVMPGSAAVANFGTTKIANFETAESEQNLPVNIPMASNDTPTEDITDEIEVDNTLITEPLETELHNSLKTIIESANEIETEDITLIIETMKTELTETEFHNSLRTIIELANGIETEDIFIIDGVIEYIPDETETDDSPTIKDKVRRSSSRGIIYVDDDADPSWYDPTHVKTIQEGIDNASTGDTVYVFNGIYSENVLVNKSVDLTGESKEGTIIDANGTFGKVVEVTVNNVNISTFSIRNDFNGLCISTSSNNNIIDCDVYNTTSDGFYISSSSNNDFIGCNAYNTGGYGFNIYSSSNNDFIGCNAYNTGGNGFYIFMFSSWNNFINCTSHDSPPWHATTGFYCFIYSTYNDFINCTAYNRNQGWIIVMSDYTDLINCVAYNNWVGISGTSNYYVNIIDCTFYDNGLPPDPDPFAPLGSALSLGGVNSNIINCTAYNNPGDGFLFHEESYNVNVWNCTAYNNTGYGIKLERVSLFNLRDNTLYDNRYNFEVDGDVYSYGLYHYDHDVDTSNTVDGKPIYYLIEQSDIEINETHDPGYLVLYSCNNVTAKNLDICGIVLPDTHHSTISNVSAHNNYFACHLDDSSYLSIMNCTFSDSDRGLWVERSSSGASSNCDLTGNSIYNCEFSFYLFRSQDFTLRDNSFYGDFMVQGYSVEDYYHDIDTSNTNYGKPIYYLVEQKSHIEINETHNAGYVGLISCNNVTAKNLDIYGSVLINTSDSTISNVSVHERYFSIGIILDYGSTNNNIINCTVYNIGMGEEGMPFELRTGRGLQISSGNNNNVINCDFYNISQVGAYFSYWNVENNNVINCTFHDNGDTGLRVFGINTNVINCEFYNNLRVGFGFGGESINLTNCNSYNNENGMDFQDPEVNVIDCNVYNNSNYGIRIVAPPMSTVVDNNITNCSFYNNKYGLYLEAASRGYLLDNHITNCSSYNNEYGIYISGGRRSTLSNNEIYFCTFYNNSDYGFYVYVGSGASVANNLIHHNNFINNTVNAYDPGINQWYLGLGNHWSDYTGPDINGDGIGDIPYDIPGGTNQDLYPLMNPVIPYLADYDVGVTSINGLYSGPASGPRGVFTPEVSVRNHGQLVVCCFTVNLQIEKVNATVEYNESQCIPYDLYPGETVILTFPDWTPEDLQYGLSGSIDYDVTACTQLTNDLIPINDGKTMSITLEYFHDVRVKQITKPIVGGLEPQWVHFDNGIFYDAIGIIVGGTFEAAIRITPDELGGLDGYTLTSVKFYHYVYEGTNSTHSGNIKIYEDDTPYQPGGLITSEPYSVTGSGWFEINLSEPVTLDISEDIWVSVEVTHEVGEYPIGCDEGPAVDGKGDWYNPGTGWEELQVYGLDYNWLIHAFVECLEEPIKAGTHQVEAIVDNIGVFPESNLTVNAKIFKDRNLIYESNYTVTSLDVGEEDTATFDDWTVTESGMYTLEINIQLITDDYPDNNTEIAEIGVDGEAPVTTCTLDPATPDGDNDWYVSDVTVEFEATDGMEPWQSGVDHIEYKVDGGSVQTGDSVTVTTDGLHTVEYRAIDNVGNEEDWNSVSFKIDQTAPESVVLTYEASGNNIQGWEITFTATGSDATSGVDRVEFAINDDVWFTDDEAPYEWILEWSSSFQGATFKATMFDKAGNSDFDELTGIEAFPYPHSNPNPSVRQINQNPL